MCNFPTVKDAADVAIATMLSGIQVGLNANCVLAFTVLWIIHSLSLGVKSGANGRGSSESYQYC
jgi:hypothetical protein